MTNHYKKARDHEEAGEYQAASHVYAADSFTMMNENDFSPSGDLTFMVAIAYLIKSASCAARAGNQQRTRAIRDAAEAYIRHALREEARDDRTQDGLYHEWLGDIHLMTRSPTAITHYRTARGYYADTSPSMQRTWGGEEAFNYAHWAVESFLEDTGHDDEIEELQPLDFPGRIEIKTELAMQLVER